MVGELERKHFIYAIDPGPDESGYVMLDMRDYAVVECGHESNRLLESQMESMSRYVLFVSEDVVCYGMAVGQSTIDTCVQIGRFSKAAEKVNATLSRINRREIKLALCGSMKAKDGNVRQAIIDMYGGAEIAQGGVKCKKCKGKGWFGAGRPVCQKCKGGGWEYPPGPLVDVKSHAWSALAVGLTYAIHQGLLTPLAASPGGLCKNSQPSSRDCPPSTLTENSTRPGEPS